MTKNLSSTIAVHDPLGGKTTLAPIDPAYQNPDYSVEGIKKSLDKHGLMPVEKVQLKNPITDEVTTVTIRRDGTPESKMISVMADPNASREQKDSILSLYLFERGKESASFLADLMIYKGSHTKETRAFKSQMRFDFEMFIQLQVGLMRSKAKAVFETFVVTDIELFCKEATAALKAGNTFHKFCSEQGIIERSEVSILHGAVIEWMEAERFEEKIKAVTHSREREKGFGIYIDVEGRPYSIFEDEGVEEVVKADIARRAELNKE